MDIRRWLTHCFVFSVSTPSSPAVISQQRLTSAMVALVSCTKSLLRDCPPRQLPSSCCCHRPFLLIALPFSPPATIDPVAYVIWCPSRSILPGLGPTCLDVTGPACVRKKSPLPPLGHSGAHHPLLLHLRVCLSKTYNATCCCEGWDLLAAV